MTTVQLARALQSPEHHPSSDETDMAIPLPFREDTLLGVCQAIGDDIGFNPDYLRVALAASLLWNAKAVILGYLAAGVLVALLRWLVPSRQPAVEETPALSTAPPAVEQEREPLPLAA